MHHGGLHLLLLHRACVPVVLALPLLGATFAGYFLVRPHFPRHDVQLGVLHHGGVSLPSVHDGDQALLLHFLEDVAKCGATSYLRRKARLYEVCNV